MPAKEKLPWFPFYPTHFLSDEKVIMMSALECGAYIRLLCIAWDSHPIGTLLGSDKALARLATLNDEEWVSHKDAIMAPFEFIDGRWHQKRMIEEGIVSLEKHRKSVESGERGAKKRWAKNSHPIAKLEEPNSNNKTIPTNPPLPPKRGKDYEDADVPLILRVPHFFQAWSDFKRDRRSRKKPMTTLAQEMALEDCVSMGVDKSVETIRNSIISGYSGLFERKQLNGSNGHTNGHETKRNSLVSTS